MTILPHILCFHMLKIEFYKPLKHKSWCFYFIPIFIFSLSLKQSLIFRNSNNVLISGLTSTNSELYHIVIDNCDAVTVQGVKINAPGNSPNTDGIHVQGSTGVTITGASIRTGDDCVSIGPGTTNLWIELVSCGPGHGIRFLLLHF